MRRDRGHSTTDRLTHVASKRPFVPRELTVCLPYVHAEHLYSTSFWVPFGLLFAALKHPPSVPSPHRSHGSQHKHMDGVRGKGLQHSFHFRPREAGL